jgi:hypothetical protein
METSVGKLDESLGSASQRWSYSSSLDSCLVRARIDYFRLWVTQLFQVERSVRCSSARVEIDGVWSESLCAMESTLALRAL